MKPQHGASDYTNDVVRDVKPRAETLMSYYDA